MAESSKIETAVAQLQRYFNQLFFSAFLRQVACCMGVRAFKMPQSTSSLKLVGSFIHLCTSKGSEHNGKVEASLNCAAWL